LILNQGNKLSIILIAFVSTHIIGEARRRPISPAILNRRIMMKIRPLNDRVLVVGIEEKEKTTGGIIIPDTAKEKPQEGKVVAVGPGKWDENGKRIPLEVKKDDRVLFGKYAGNEIRIDGVEHLIMREDDILGIIKK
jgi:chaperonin GroES